MPAWPRVERVNRYGDFALNHSRLAFVDGSADPWIYATPHSPLAPARQSIIDQPFLLIRDGVHHWDENAAMDEPPELARVHAAQIAFVRAWLSDRRA